MKKIIFLSFFIFFPSAFVFFSADDWFHLRVSQISSIPEFLNFFSFAKSGQSIAFYRPLPTQVFFYIFQKLFGLNCFGYSLYLVNKLATKLLNSDRKALLATLIYGVSVSNFTRLYFLSAFQEVALVIFSLLMIINYLEEKKKKSLLFFLLALLSKETAVILPVILIFIDWSQKKVNFSKLIPFGIILLPYLYLRLFLFGEAVGETYIWNFSLLKAANNLMWYDLWSVGAPELLVDYIGSGLRPIPRFFTDLPLWGPVILGFLIANIIPLGLLFLKK